MSESAVDAPSAQAGAGPGAHPGPARPWVMPARFAIPLALGSGVCLDLALPGLGWWPMAAVGVAALALAVRGRRSRTAAMLGLLAGWGYFIPALHWSGVYVGVLPWFALATLQALFVTVMALLMPWSWSAPGGRAGTVLAITGLWVAQEAARGTVPFGGFPWARLAFGQADAPTLRLAALGGAPLVTAAVAAAGALLAVAVVSAVQGSVAGASITAGLAILVTVSGWAVPSSIIDPGADRSLRVAAVQGNVPAPGLDFNAERRAVLDNHATVTRGLAQQVDDGTAARPDAVFWPENSSDIDPLVNPDAAAVISGAADAIAVPIVVGAVLQTPPGRLSNASIVWSPGPDGGPGAQYVKRHPAPFGEYIPYRSFFRRFSDKVDLVRRDFVAGDRVGVLPVAGTQVGTVICFEVAYDSLVRDTVRGGAELLLVQTNNATFGYTDESTQQLAMSRLRAVESGRAVVHISTVGVSALIAPDGSVLRDSTLFTADLLTGELPLSDHRTLATRVGDGPQTALTVIGLALVLAGARRRKAGTR